ncbi:MAG TPA: hypothetical protein VFH25_00165 [Nitrososphaeraceae archaeon]|jgi:hypothetical protein|nr:hypothetical protein [Nitrososphaeraceae archaeon]
MAINNNAKITTVVGIIAIVTSLFIATMMNMVHQQAYALSKYDAPDDAANGKTNQELQDDIGNTAQPPITTPTLPAIPTTNCAMGTIESLESFLSCLGAK